MIIWSGKGLLIVLAMGLGMLAGNVAAQMLVAHIFFPPFDAGGHLMKVVSAVIILFFFTFSSPFTALRALWRGQPCSKACLRA